jgi:serine/threonine protein kinase
MEFLSGGELFDAICQQEYYMEGDARRVMHSLLTAVEYLHQHGVMHRDLKPENLILINNSRDTDIKIIDFGLATTFGGIQPKPTSLCGTPGYVAPEMLKMSPYGPEVDMWSVGVIMYVLLSGMAPFSHPDIAELFQLIQVSVVVNK